MKVELLIKKKAPLSEQARAVLEELGEELDLEVEVIDVEADSFLYLRHRYDLPVIKLDGRILSQRTADRDEIARRLRHARRMKESQSIEGRLAAGQDGRRVVKVSLSEVGTAPRPAPPPYAAPPREIAGDRRVVRVSLSDVAGQAFPKAPTAPAEEEAAAEPAEKLAPLPLPAPGGEVFFADGFAGAGLRRRLEATSGVEEVRLGRVTGAVGLRGDPEATRAAAERHGGSAAPSAPRLSLGLAGAALALGLGAWLAGASPFSWILAACAALLPLALREGRWLLRDLPLVGAHPLLAGAAFLVAGAQGALPPALAAGPAAVHLVGLAFLLDARRRTRETLADDAPAETPTGRVVVEEGAAFPADGRLLHGCLVDETPLQGEEDAERLAGEEVFAGSIALERAEIEVLPGPARRSQGRRRLERALAELETDSRARLLPLSPLLGLAAAGAAWALHGPAIGAPVLGAFPALAIAFFVPLGRAMALVGAFVDGAAAATWRAIARAGQVRTVVFGKRSLLERGEPAVLGVRARRLEPLRLLELAAAAEAGVDHPIARSIRSHARELGVRPPAPAGAPRAETGGVEAEVEGERVLVGAPSFLAKQGVDVSAYLSLAQEVGQRGSTPVVIAVGGEAAGLVEIGAFPSEGARLAIGSLELREVGLVVATSDHDLRAKWLAQALGLDPSQAAGDLSAEREARLLEGLRRPILLAGGRDHLSRTDEADLAIGADGPREDLPAFLLRPDPRGIASLVRTGRVARRASALGGAALALQAAALLAMAAVGLLAPVGALALSLGATALSLGAALAPGLSLR